MNDFMEVNFINEDPKTKKWLFSSALLVAIRSILVLIPRILDEDRFLKNVDGYWDQFSFVLLQKC